MRELTAFPRPPSWRRKGGRGNRERGSGKGRGGREREMEGGDGTG